MHSKLVLNVTNPSYNSTLAIRNQSLPFLYPENVSRVLARSAVAQGYGP